MPGRIPPDIIDRIRESTDIVDLISGYVKLEKKGANYFGLCPFHPEKTPSFSVHPGKQIFHCFGCGLGGNAFTFLQEHDKLSFAEAARELAQRAGIEIPEAKPERAEKYDALYRANAFTCEFYSRCLWEGKGEEYEKARGYLKERKIGEDLAKGFKLGYAPDSWDGLIRGVKTLAKGEFNPRDFIDAGLLLQKESSPYDRFRGRLMFPILNLSGKPVGFGGRTLKADDEGAKYINTPQTAIYNKGSILYGLYLAREQVRRRGECLIVEGYTDLMRLHDGGFTHSVATSGTALTVEQARLLRRFCRKVILIFDGDSAGSHAALHGGDVLLAAGLDVRVVGLPEGYDPDRFILQKGPGALGDLLEEAMDMITYRIELYRKEDRLKDVPSRSEVARELLASLAVIPDPIRRELSAQEAARQIGVAQETMLKELGRAASRSRAEAQASTGNGSRSAYPDNERGLAEALIRWPELRAATFSAISSQDFRHEQLRRIASLLEDAWIKGEEPKGEELIEEETALEDARFISAALSQMESLSKRGVDPKAKRRYDDFIYAQDCLRALLVVKLNQDDQNLKAELLKKPAIERVLEIQGEIKKIKEQQKAIREKKFWPLPRHPGMDFPEKSEKVAEGQTGSG